jgi:hypothetical protein
MLKANGENVRTGRSKIHAAAKNTFQDKTLRRLDCSSSEKM